MHPESSVSTINSEHPYFIATGDNPSVLIVPTVLTGAADYYSWARSMRMALMTKNKVGFIDAAFPAWQRANVLVLGWLTKAVSSEIGQSIIWLDSAREVWLDIQERFGRSSLVRINDLHDQISSFRQGALSVSSYYTRFKVLWDEYAMYRPVPACTCSPRCSCAALSTVREYFRTEQIIRFLRGLNPAFAHARSQILRSEPLIPINQVFAIIAQEEQEIGIQASNSNVHQASGFPQITQGQSSQVLAAGPPIHNFKKGSKRPVCTHCGAIGHTIEKCYKKIGYPPGYRNKGKEVVVNSVQTVDQGGAEADSSGVTLS
ncbi:hypothetical protein LINPERHAP1_LOCUS2603 [Linum perenne]